MNDLANPNKILIKAAGFPFILNETTFNFSGTAINNTCLEKGFEIRAKIKFFAFYKFLLKTAKTTFCAVKREGIAISKNYLKKKPKI